MKGSRHTVVTGGAGFIGSHLVERLLAEGKKVTVLDDLSTGNLDNLKSVRAHPNLRVLVSRVSACQELVSLLNTADAVFHLAAAVGVELVIREPIRTIHNNLRETEAVLEAASQFRVPVLITSTSEVYGKSRQAHFAEADDLLIGPPHLGRWRYACSKLMDEFMALAYAEERRLPVILARVFNTVGPRQSGRYGMVLPRFIAAAKAGEPLRVFGDGTQSRCFCYVADTVEALIRLMNCPAARGQVVNVGSHEEITIHDLAELVKQVLDSVSPIELVPYDQAYAPGFEDMQRRRPRIDKLFQMTQFSPQTAIRQIIQLTAR